MDLDTVLKQIATELDHRALLAQRELRHIATAGQQRYTEGMAQAYANSAEVVQQFLRGHGLAA